MPIGRWVLREACRQGRQIQALLPADPPLSMSVNLSVKQLQHSDIVADVRDALAESGLPPASLTLEITETVLMTDTDIAVQRLVRAQGARRAARDGRLRHRLLVAELPQPLPRRHPQDGPLVPARRRDAADLAASPSAVIALGETLQLEVVAEGIEFDEQWRGAARPRLRPRARASCSRSPMDADATLEYLRTASRRRPEPSGADAP